MSLSQRIRINGSSYEHLDGLTHVPSFVQANLRAVSANAPGFIRVNGKVYMNVDPIRTAADASKPPIASASLSKMVNTVWRMIMDTLASHFSDIPQEAHQLLYNELIDAFKSMGMREDPGLSGSPPGLTKSPNPDSPSIAKAKLHSLVHTFWRMTMDFLMSSYTDFPFESQQRLRDNLEGVFRSMGMRSTNDVEEKAASVH